MITVTTVSAPTRYLPSETSPHRVMSKYSATN